MKKISIVLLCVLLLVTLTGCNALFGNIRIDDPSRYGEYSTKDSFLPQDITEYTVNKYSCNIYAYFDICHQLYLDITVTKEQFELIISEARKNKDFKYEKQSYYDEDYIEIVMCDSYDIYDHDEDSPEKKVGWADIDKIIYNPQTLNIIFVCFHANDTGVYPLNEVEYFNRFSIDETEYVENIEENEQK